MEISATECGWTGGDEVSADEAALQEFCRRWLPLPPEVAYQVRNGMLEILAEPEVREKMSGILELMADAADAIARRDGVASERFHGQLLTINPHCRDARENRVLALLALDRCDDALDELLVGLRLDPEHAPYHSFLSRCLPDTPEGAELARVSLLRAVELGSDISMDYATLGGHALDAQRLQEALEFTDRALALDPVNPSALYIRGTALMNLGQSQEAALEFERSFANLGPSEEGEGEEVRQNYFRCCMDILDSTDPGDGELIRRETARIEAECGWTVEFRECAAENQNPADPSDESMESAIVWLDANAPGRVAILAPAEMLEWPMFVLPQLLEIRQEALALGATKGAGSRIRLRQAVANLAREWFLPPEISRDPSDKPMQQILGKHLLSLFTGLVARPLDWLLDLQFAREFPQFRHARLIHLSEWADLALKFAADGEIRPLLKPRMLAAFDILHGAGALFLAALSHGLIDYTKTHRTLPTWDRAVRIHDHFRSRTEHPMPPGDEFRIVSEIAALAGIIPSGLGEI